jgi:hypothetical protein
LLTGMNFRIGANSVDPISSSSPNSFIVHGVSTILLARVLYIFPLNLLAKSYPTLLVDVLVSWLGNL